MSAFKVGDVCEVLWTHYEKYSYRIGCVGKVVDISTAACADGTFVGYRLDTDDMPPNKRWHEEQLRKIDPPSTYDGNQAGDWSLIPWQPKRERVS